MGFNKSLFLILVMAGMMTGCFSVPEFPMAPEIKFDNISTEPRLEQISGLFKDSIVISIGYKDGDGDLGVLTWETDSLSSLEEYNFVVKQFRRANGKYVEYTPSGTLSGFFPYIGPVNPGPLEGVIHYTGIQIYHSFYEFKRDTVKFEIYIKDRAGNKSNTILTDSVIVNTL